MNVQTPIPTSGRKPPRLRSIFRFRRIPSFLRTGAGYVVPTLEAVTMASDAFPPLKSASGGALWIATALLEYKSSRKDEKAFAEYLQQSIACVIASVVKNGDLASLEQHVQRLNITLDEIRTEIIHWQSQPSRKRFGRFIKNRQPIQKYRKCLDDALVVFNLGTTIAAHDELSKILSDTYSVISALRGVKEDVRRVRKDVSQTKGIAQDTQRRTVRIGGNLQKVALAVDSVHADIGGLATAEDVRKIEIQMHRIESRLMVDTPSGAGLNAKARTAKGYTPIKASTLTITVLGVFLG